MNNLASMVSATKRSQVYYALFVIIGSVVFFVVSWPAWKLASSNEKIILNSVSRIESLTRMASAGAWFNAAAIVWQPKQQEQYARLFPATKRREELFLLLAQAAVAAEIDPITLREIPTAIIVEDEYEFEDELAESPDETDLEMLADQFATVISGQPSSELTTFRLAATFVADYTRLTRFIDGVNNIPRALTLQSLTGVTDPDGINVSMELEFYVQDTH